MQGPESPFYGWYDFTEQADGAPYKSWWGHLSLPEVDERDASWQRYILGEGETDGSRRGGVLGSWLAAGVRGYRLDVADEIPDDVLERIRTCVKSAKPDAAVIGEVWEDPTTKRSYGVPRTYALGRSLDSVMNYPLRDALIGFAIGRLDAHQLAAFLKSQQANYPGPMHACLMNLLSTHDVERVRSALAVRGPLKQLKRDAQFALGTGLAPCLDARAARQQRMIASLMYALPGTPCIYYGDERGLQGGGDPFCRATFPWDDAGVLPAHRVPAQGFAGAATRAHGVHGAQRGCGLRSARCGGRDPFVRRRQPLRRAVPRRLRRDGARCRPSRLGGFGATWPRWPAPGCLRRLQRGA